MRIARRIVSVLFGNAIGTAVARRVLPVLDRLVFGLSRGRYTFTGMVEPVLVLESVGARSGELRQSPLLYIKDGPRFVVAASNFGQAPHPAWSANLLSNPDATVILRGQRMPVRAQTIDAEGERAVLWTQLDDLYSGYKRYRKVTADVRDVRMFALVPTSPSR